MNGLERVAEAFLVIATFAATYERVVELIRAMPAKKQAASVWVDRLTTGALNVVPAVTLSLLTQADLLALFRNSRLRGEAVDFFGLYLQPPLSVWRDMELGDYAHHLAGCVLMGFAITLGSQYWHDVGKGIIDLRNSLKRPGQKPSTPTDS